MKHFKNIVFFLITTLFVACTNIRYIESPNNITFDLLAINNEKLYLSNTYSFFEFVDPKDKIQFIADNKNLISTIKINSISEVKEKKNSLPLKLSMEIEFKEALTYFDEDKKELVASKKIPLIFSGEQIHSEEKIILLREDTKNKNLLQSPLNSTYISYAAIEEPNIITSILIFPFVAIAAIISLPITLLQLGVWLSQGG